MFKHKSPYGVEFGYPIGSRSEIDRFCSFVKRIFFYACFSVLVVFVVWALLKLSGLAI